MAEPLHNTDDLIASSWSVHPEFEKLLERMIRWRSTARRWSGEGYRFVEPKFARRGDGVSGLGAKQFGGRWNPAGLATVYGSTSPIGAAAEAFGHFGHYGFRVDQATPRIVFAFQAKLLRVLDLTHGRTRQRLRVSEQRMLHCEWKRSRRTGQEQLSQAIGRAAAAAGMHGLLVPSVQSEAPNVVVFPEHLPASCRLTVVNADEFDG
ncbi:MAG: RES domain-containing protein [Phycisphaeraceae bacterium]